MSDLTTLKKVTAVSTPPPFFRVLESIDGSYSLEYSYSDAENVTFVTLITSRAQVKNYKSLRSVFNDIRSINARPTIFFEFSEVSSTLLK